MRLTFVETPLFRQTARSVLTDAALRALQGELLENPGAGAVIRGTRGARKIRVARERGGKSGGARVVYVYVPERDHVYLLLAYAKGVADDISEAGRRALARLVAEIVAE